MMRSVGYPVGRTLLTALLVWVSATPSLAAQEQGQVSSEENFRRDPNGELLGQLGVGAPVTVLGRDDNWLQVRVTGWIWERSLQRSGRDDFDLVVSESEGENLRREPSGDILGRFGRGTFLTGGAREPGWIQVTRTGWIWAASVEMDATTAEPAGAEGPGSPSSTNPPASDDSAQDIAASVPSTSRPTGFVRTGASGAAVLTAPDGDTLAVAVPDADLEITARDGNWARVRVEGWAWMPEADENLDDEPVDGLTPDDLVADPAGYRGRVVSWALQFISLERAEGVRTDFFEGEPFLLARFGGPDGPFVYVALPPDGLETGESLLPLERLRITGRVRTGASALTGTPILDLITLERIRGGD